MPEEAAKGLLKQVSAAPVVPVPAVIARVIEAELAVTVFPPASSTVTAACCAHAVHAASAAAGLRGEGKLRRRARGDVERATGRAGESVRCSRQRVAGANLVDLAGSERRHARRGRERIRRASQRRSCCARGGCDCEGDRSRAARHRDSGRHPRPSQPAAWPTPLRRVPPSGCAVNAEAWPPPRKY